MSKIEHLGDILGENITLPVIHGASLRSRKGMIIDEHYLSRGQHQYMVSTIGFSLHSGTHIDTHLNRNDLKRDFSNFLKSENEENGDILFIDPSEREESLKFEILKQYSTPIIVDCLVIDFTSKQGHVNEKLLSFQDESYNSRHLLNDTMNDLEYKKLFESLSIKFSEISKKLEKANFSESDLEEKFLIFKTGWDVFRPTDSLNNPIFEGWHAFLTHPYVDTSCMKKLIDFDILGMGSEIPSMENFLFYVEEPRALSFVRNLSITIREEAQFEQFRPVHTYMLLTQRKDESLKYRYLIENIGNLRFIHTTPSSPVVECKLSIIPFPLCVSNLGLNTLGRREILDGILCSLYCKVIS